MLLFTMSTIFTGTKEEVSTLNEETKTIVATFVGFHNGGLQFKSDDKLMVFFIDNTALAKSVSTKINFKDPSIKGKSYKIEYTEDNATYEQGDSYIYRSIKSIEQDFSSED